MEFEGKPMFLKEKTHILKGKSMFLTRKNIVFEGKFMVFSKKNMVYEGKFIEKIGFYNPIAIRKVFKVEEERVTHWISKGAKPTDTVASLCKKNGIAGMDKYIGKRDLQRKKKNDDASE